MITLFTLSLLCLAVILVLGVVLTILSVPFLGHPGLLPWLPAHRRRGPADPRTAGPSLPLGKSDPCRCRLWAFCSSALT